MMNVLLTGGTGFLGSRLLIDLCSNDQVDKVHLIYRNSDKLRILEEFLEKDWHKVVPIQGDLVNLEVDFSDVDVLIHTAAVRNIGYCESHLQEVFNVNVKGLIRLFEAAKNGGVKKCIYISTQGVYNDSDTGIVTELSGVRPSTAYAKGKYTGELITQMIFNDLAYMIFRPSRLFGWSIFVNQDNFLTGIYPAKCFKGEDLLVYGDGSQTINVIDVEDVSDVILKSLMSEDESLWNETYNLCGDDSVSIKDMAEEYQRWAHDQGLDIAIIHKDGSNQKDFLNLSNSKLKHSMRWQPKQLSESIRGMLDSMKPD